MCFEIIPAILSMSNLRRKTLKFRNQISRNRTPGKFTIFLRALLYAKFIANVTHIRGCVRYERNSRKRWRPSPDWATGKTFLSLASGLIVRPWFKLFFLMYTHTARVT